VVEICLQQRATAKLISNQLEKHLLQNPEMLIFSTAQVGMIFW